MNQKEERKERNNSWLGFLLSFQGLLRLPSTVMDGL
jgi:hypothetical protein